MSLKQTIKRAEDAIAQRVELHKAIRSGRQAGLTIGELRAVLAEEEIRLSHATIVRICGETRENAQAGRQPVALDIRDRVIAEIRRGDPHDDVATRNRVSRTSIWNWTRGLGLPRRKPGPKPDSHEGQRAA